MQEREADLGFKSLFICQNSPLKLCLHLVCACQSTSFLSRFSSCNFHSVGLGRSHLAPQTLLMEQLSPISSTESETGQKVSKGWIEPPCTPSVRQCYFTLKAKIKHQLENGNWIT